MQQLLVECSVSSLSLEQKQGFFMGFWTYSIQMQTCLAEFLKHRTSSETGLLEVQHTSVILKAHKLPGAVP